MLPLITPEINQKVMEEIGDDVRAWRKTMIHYIKEDNPEINDIVVKLSQDLGLEPKALATGAYVVYKMLEIAVQEQLHTHSNP